MPVTPQDAGLLDMVRGTFTPQPPARLGVAVSGGSDSLALLHLLADWRDQGGPALGVVTVDHGLRPESADEAAGVAALCAGLGSVHQTLRWQWDGAGNLPDQARRARLRLIGDWARAEGISAVALGHTEDDQAETVLMRLARGSGIDGLSAMAPRRHAGGIDWVRPLLGATRRDLRAYLTRRDVAWFDDPGNDDEGYDRVKARMALRLLEPLGIDARGLAATASRLAVARDALSQAAHDLAERASRLEAGEVLIASDVFRRAPYEIQLRVFSHAVCWVASAEYRPRRRAAEAALAEGLSGHRHTLAGCVISAQGGILRIGREFNAVRDRISGPEELWDGRWRLAPPESVSLKGLEIRALGAEGLETCPDWRATGVPRETLLASPSVWQDTRMIAAPLAGRAEGWVANMACDEVDFLSGLLSH